MILPIPSQCIWQISGSSATTAAWGGPCGTSRQEGRRPGGSVPLSKILAGCSAGAAASLSGAGREYTRGDLLDLFKGLVHTKPGHQTQGRQQEYARRDSRRTVRG